MRTETQKAYDHGFELNEQALRRVYDDCLKNLTKKIPREAVVQKLTIKFSNGSVAEPSSLDEVLEQENQGSKAIRYLGLHLSNAGFSPPYSIRLEFREPAAIDEKDSSGVRLEVLGDDRDWVFVTTAELEERITHMRTTLIQVKYVWRLVTTLLYVLGVLWGARLVAETGKAETDHAYIQQVRTEWEAGSLKDPIEAIIRIAEAQSRTRAATMSSMHSLKPLLHLFALVMASMLWGLTIIGRAYRYLFPQFRFAWGGAAAEYEKKRKLANLIFVVLLLSLVLGVVSSLVANGIWAKYFTSGTGGP